MMIIVQFSGGKDSHASLIWTVKKYGASNVLAVFNDTGHEAISTVPHLKNVCQMLDVKLIILKSKVYSSLVDLSVKKGRFPSALARFCTSELKVKPFIDWLLESVYDNVLIVQGIRALESHKRSKMNASCRFFKHYFIPYKVSKRGDKVYHNYRTKEVKKWCQSYDDTLLRPVFDWTGQQVIDYIIANGHIPNPLYSKGMKRVGCFPCVLSNHSQIREIAERFPDRIDYIRKAEKKLNTGFFSSKIIPVRFHTGRGITKKNVPFNYPTIDDVVLYLRSKEPHQSLFDINRFESCSSYYYLCE